MLACFLDIVGDSPICQKHFICSLVKLIHNEACQESCSLVKEAKESVATTHLKGQESENG
jgi:hypothetical protein